MAAAVEVASVLRQEQLTGTLEALVTQLVAPTPLVLGLAALPSLYAAARVALYLAIAALWLDVDSGTPAGADSWPCSRRRRRQWSRSGSCLARSCCS